jgi:hypothetical protein
VSWWALVLLWAGFFAVYFWLARRPENSCDDCRRVDRPLYVRDGGLVCDVCLTREAEIHLLSTEGGDRAA